MDVYYYIYMFIKVRNRTPAHDGDSEGRYVVLPMVDVVKVLLAQKVTATLSLSHMHTRIHTDPQIRCFVEIDKCEHNANTTRTNWNGRFVLMNKIRENETFTEFNFFFVKTTTRRSSHCRCLLSMWRGSTWTLTVNTLRCNFACFIRRHFYMLRLRQYG